MSIMGQPPKKQTTRRKVGMRRSHHVLKLAKRVNSRSPVKVTLKKTKKAAFKA